MNDKPFKTHDELIAQLCSRGIDLSTTALKSYAKKRLQHEGYYNLINGYKQPFLIEKSAPAEEDHFKYGTTVNEIYALYNFDRRIRNIFFKNILIIETNVKSLIAYYFPQKYGHDNYLLYANFDTDKRDSNKNITALLSEIQRQISSRYSDPSISHYLKKYGYIPLWVLNNILTLGTISKFYSLMKQPERQCISKTFHIQDSELESSLFYLSKIRNFCAHGNRLYCFRNKTPLINTSYHTLFNIPQNENNEFLYGKRDLFAAVIILKALLPNNVFKVFVKNVHHELDILRSHLIVLEEGDILKIMGFPSDWKNIVLSQNGMVPDGFGSIK